MTKTYTEKRSCFGGGYNTYQMTETDTWKGQQLGTELTSAHNLQMVECDHYENEDEDGIEIERDVWVKKSLVKRVIWQKDSVTNVSVLARVEYARPL
jgi:hypothetical protein